MKLEHFENLQLYYQTVKDYLLQQEALHCLMLGLCSSESLLEQPYLAVATQDRSICVAAIRTPPYQLILSKSRSKAAIEAISSDIVTKNISLPGVISLKSEAATFAKLWQSLTRQSYRLDMAQRIYQLEIVNPINYVAGYLRLATENDRSLLVSWIKAFEIEAIGKQRSEQHYQDWYDLRMSKNSLYVWHNKLPVSMAGFSGATPNGIRVNAVYTPSECRTQGYATSCVAALSQTLLDQENKYCFLFTNLANPIANNIYQKIGYQPVCEVDSYSFENQHE
ncbi:MAG: GNAT family N-acetyltransferase [Cyanobacteria bacterium P01_G01_bin.67]